LAPWRLNDLVPVHRGKLQQEAGVWNTYYGPLAANFVAPVSFHDFCSAWSNGHLINSLK